MTVDQPPFQVGQRVRVIDFRNDDRYGEGPRINRARQVLIGHHTRIQSLEFMLWRNPERQWYATLERTPQFSFDPNLYWPMSWLRASSSLSHLVQQYREADVR